MYEVYIIISSFIIILSISLFIIFYNLKNYKKHYNFPPYKSECPDFYSFDKNSGECIDKHNLFYTDDNNKCYSTNFKNENTQDNDLICKKKEWAKECLLNWDGITNNLDICK
mgnify:CR=1 FL=1